MTRAGRMKTWWFCLACCAVLASFPAYAASGPKTAEPATIKANEALYGMLPFDDVRDVADAARGFIAAPDSAIITNEAGRTVYSLQPYSFLRSEKAPATVNPVLWRQARLNLEAGLFKVTDRIYQIRALDLANMTIVEGDTGLIIIDPLLSKETAAAALELYYAHAPTADGSVNKERKPVLAVIYTHSHTDHYGGVKGVIDEADVAAGKTAVIAPDGFIEAAVSENVLAGNAMTRRAAYMYGNFLPRGEQGQVDAGLGKSVSFGQLTLIAPTDVIRESGERRTIDGVEIEFLLAPETEAPAEMLMFFPRFKALCAAEDATHTLHNLYTLRGAKVRDANKWWQALDNSIDAFADRCDVIFAQHHWPRWGREEVRRYLSQQRNAYKYIHDQTLRLANQGYTPAEISEMLTFPSSLASEWHLRGYYGTIRHNSKAVYQYYLGWYDGRPANLNPLPPVEAGRRYVDFMGGAAAVVAKAQEAYAKGEFRWVAEVLTHVVFSDPENAQARALQADALEQLGYQAESAPWRNVYLAAAFELRNGIPAGRGISTVSSDVLAAMTPELVLDYLAVRLNGPKAEGRTLRLNWELPESQGVYALSLEDSVLLYKKDRPFADPEATLSLSRPGLAAIASGTTTLEAECKAGRASVSGNAEAVDELFSLFDVFPLMFPIVTP